DSHVTGFLNGSSDHAYSLLGAHPVQQDEMSGWLFRVWAPHAKAVSVVGPFNNWSEAASPMARRPGGIWELFLSGPKPFDAYQFSILTRAGRRIRKADPYAFHTELRPGTASRLFDLSGYSWADQPWLAYRSRRPIASRPLNIYELHLGSWRRTREGRFLSYREIAQWLVPYVKEMGFTAVEFLPVTEHPLDESWGYQCTGYFAPTSRFGTPHDFMYLVDQLHQAGVAVLLDWVPAHFPRDFQGLYQYDGFPCYEYPTDQADLPKWGTKSFDFSRREVRSFLISSALFWLREYHIDGLRVDAVASMLYRDYDGRRWDAADKPGQVNPDAVSFLRQLNSAVHQAFPDALMIAEESSDWPNVTGPLEQSPKALGFDFKWNMGWAHDVLHYMALDPVYRQYNHKDLTFSLMYAFSEQFILPVSHDEVVHLKNSLIGRMPGEDALKFAGVRVFYLYMLTHPGKKLLMMGSEFGQFNEWRSEYSLDWHLLDYQPFLRHQAFFRSANQFYLANPPLWEIDDSWDGFQWICPDDAGSNILIFRRKDRSDHELLVAANFSPVDRLGYRIGVPVAGEYQVVFDTDHTDFGGSGRVNGRPIRSYPVSCHHLSHSIVVDIPPMTGLVLKLVRQQPKLPAKSRKKR
ncbi:MAG: 1,4-alpha-glucan branching protein GlgB, partial [Candidatus Onthomonas sp.]